MRAESLRAALWFIASAGMLLAGAALIVGMLNLASDRPDTLPPCPTEDSTHCYWDSSERGNGIGQDFIAP